MADGGQRKKGKRIERNRWRTLSKKNKWKQRNRWIGRSRKKPRPYRMKQKWNKWKIILTEKEKDSRFERRERKGKKEIWKGLSSMRRWLQAWLEMG